MILQELSNKKIKKPTTKQTIKGYPLVVKKGDYQILYLLFLLPFSLNLLFAPKKIFGFLKR